MRRIVGLIMVLLAGSAQMAVAQDVVPSGVWMRGDGNARVRIAPCGDKICATNVWIMDTSKGEAVGDKLVLTVKPKSGGVLTGKAFDPKRSLTYSIEITIKDTSLTTRGCFIGGMLCKTVNWARVG